MDEKVKRFIQAHHREDWQRRLRSVITIKAPRIPLPGERRER